jgi:hypothetical protein
MQSVHYTNIFSSHSFIPFSSIHPLEWTWIKIPHRSSCWSIIFCLNINNGGSFVPSAQHTRISVQCVFSWPEVLWLI